MNALNKQKKKMWEVEVQQKHQQEGLEPTASCCCFFCASMANPSLDQVAVQQKQQVELDQRPSEVHFLMYQGCTLWQRGASLVRNLHQQMS